MTKRVVIIIVVVSGIICIGLIGLDQWARYRIKKLGYAEIDGRFIGLKLDRIDLRELRIIYKATIDLEVMKNVPIKPMASFDIKSFGYEDTGIYFE